MSIERDMVLDDLVTVRDWLRFGVSRFQSEGLVFGHGTANAIDETAFLILHSLSLPIFELEPWLDARLTRAERENLLTLIERRVSTRLPAPYLVNEAWIQGYRFFVDERVIVPRSYIGELLGDDLSAVIEEPDRIGRVLDLCTGSGCLAILAALSFPNAKVDAADISRDALDVAQRNVGEYDLQDRIRLVESDLFAQLSGERYDLIIANPPYVTDAAVTAFPPEYAVEPVLAHAGGGDGLSLVRRILDEASSFLNDNGTIVVETGETEGRLEAAYPGAGFMWLDTESSEGEVFALQAAVLKGIAT